VEGFHFQEIVMHLHLLILNDVPFVEVQLLIEFVEHCSHHCYWWDGKIACHQHTKLPGFFQFHWVKKRRCS